MASPTERQNSSPSTALGKDQSAPRDPMSEHRKEDGPASKERLRRLRKEFDGGSGRKFPYEYRRPKRNVDEENMVDFDTPLARTQSPNGEGKSLYLNPFGEEVWKYEDVDTYLSTTQYAPRRLMVQASNLVLRNNDNTDVPWRRTKAQGDLPIALQMAEWAVGPDVGWFNSSWRLPMVAIPLQLFLAFPGVNAPWEMDDVDDRYLDYVGYYWRWPKHAINPLDMKEGADGAKKYQKQGVLSSRMRLLRPRQLIVLQEGKWSLDTNPSPRLQYVFISWTWSAFSRKDKNNKDDGSGLKKVHLMAKYMTLKEGLSAYWLDAECNAPEDQPDLLTADVNHIRQDLQNGRLGPVKTLPEGLLAPGDIHVCVWHGKGNYRVSNLGKVEMTSRYWKDKSEESPARILAEHYTGTTTLSRLELLSTAITALSNRYTSKDHTGADTAYAFMGLLHYRVDPDPTDDIFQVVARLSLLNDNDRLIERMVAMFPSPITDSRNVFKVLAEQDQYKTHLWDVEPRCTVVGLGDEPSTVILDECRAVPIRWKRFPRMTYKRHMGMKKSIAELFVRSGAWWMITGYSLAFTYAPFFIANPGGEEKLYKYLVGVIGIFVGVGLLLSCLAPHAVLRLFGGQVLESTPHLVGLEGTMPIKQLEKIIFGDSRGRLTYEPSSTPFSFDNRDPIFRKGEEPDWVSKSQPELANPPLLEKHHIFTLVDTGNLTVSIFQAKRPPTVALICGTEGGMLRAVLCSWRFANDCLYKETVIRVQTSTWEQAKPAGWLKLSLVGRSVD